MVHIRCNTSEKMCDMIETGPGIIFLDRNRNLYDIYDSYRSIQVARSLFENTFLSGTIRSNRKHISSQLKSKLEVGECKYQRNREILLLAYREKKSQKKNVLLLSTHRTAANKTTVIRRRNQQREVQKPAIIHDYNKYIGGIDVSDMMIYSYLDERRTVKYWKKLVFSIFARMVLNAYILYKHNREAKVMNRLELVTSIIQSITTEWLAEKNVNPESSLGHTSRDSTVPGISKLPGRREKVCVDCSRLDGGPVPTCVVDLSDACRASQRYLSVSLSDFCYFIANDSKMQ
ncbi:hypothetical protein M0804_010231 [Polistes exclamans]|nr:hypothetical protein M0804_010231 [Polistes exclamans]